MIWIWLLSNPIGETALFFFFKLILLSRDVPLTMVSVSPVVSTELWVASLSSEDLRLRIPSGSWLNDRRKKGAVSLLLRKKGLGSEEFSRSSALLRRKLEDLWEDATDKEPAFILRFMESLVYFTKSRFSSAVLSKQFRAKLRLEKFPYIKRSAINILRGRTDFK